MAKNPDRKIYDKERFVECDPAGILDPNYPGTGAQVPPTVQDLLDTGKRVNQAQGGIMNTPVASPFVTFNAAQNEKVMAHGNAYIVFGADRPSTEASGQGAVGADAPTIDLVVGRAASSHGGKGPCDGMFVGNSMFADAARIYISRSTRVDKNFGITRTSTDEAVDKDGNEPQRSAIALKADKVRIIGRSGVKIVTGGALDIKGYDYRGETDSFGGKLMPAPSIDLIAGNLSNTQRWISLWGKEESYLQPIALGYRTRDALDELAVIVDHILGLVFQSELLTSTCFSAMGAVLSPLSAATGADATARMNFVSSPSYNVRTSMTEFNGKYLLPEAPRAVWSKNVNAT